MELTQTDSAYILSLPARFAGQEPKNATALVRDELDEGRIHHLEVDFEETIFIDSFGIGCIVSIAKQLQENGGTLSAINLHGEIKELFEDTGLDQLLTIEETAPGPRPTSVDIKLDLSEETTDGIYILSLGGIMNHPAGSDRFREHFLLALAEHKKILVDLSELTFFDSMSIGVMLNMSKLAKETGVDIRLCGANMIVSDLFATLSVDKVINSFPTREEALENW